MIKWIIFSAFLAIAHGCGFPGAPAHSTVVFDTEILGPGTRATYKCDRGFELLGPTYKMCNRNGTWSPPGIPFCVLNVAAGKAPMQSSTENGGIPQRAVDGSSSSFFTLDTCSLTSAEKQPWWYVNLLEPYMVQLVRLDFGFSCCANSQLATITVRVGNNRPDLGVNPICNRFIGQVEEGRPLFLPCNPPMPGAFVSVHFEGPPGSKLSICEAFVYTDQALPIERCPSFRDQPPGITSTYNGKCYLFYKQKEMDFDQALDYCRKTGGSLLDETNPALQGFLSWELWRRHRGDPNGQYWLGAVRDLDNRNNWKWINGRDVTVSFWNLPGGNENCARFDGTKGWLWSDTRCDARLHFICQHRPQTCGKPEQPPNSTMSASQGFMVGSKVRYDCDPGHMLVGPPERICHNSGFFDEFPPTCRYLECGPPASIRFGTYELVNGTRHHQSVVKYFCQEDYTLVGRSELICDVDERWNGPPPRCERTRPVKPGLDGIRPNPELDHNALDPIDSVVDESIVSYVEIPNNDHPSKKGNSGGHSVNNPNFTQEENFDNGEPKLNTGGMIALGVFGGFVVLAALITTVVILVKRTQSPPSKKYLRRHDDGTASSESSSTDGHGLNKFYKRAWENLREGGSPLPRDLEKAGMSGHPKLSRTETLDNPDYRSTRSMGQEGLRDGSEMTVNDVAAMYTRPEKRRHHHHHHGHRHKSHDRDHDHHEREDRHERDRHDRDWPDRDRRKY